MLLPEIAKLADVTAVVEQDSIDPKPPCSIITIDEFRGRRDEFDAIIAQLGNNIHHEFVWREARAHPCVVVLHELVLHHLITEATLARGDGESFIELMRESDGLAGEAFARGRAFGHHFETGNFLFPGSSAIASSSHAIIVHNRWASERLIESGVRTSIRVIDHPLDRLHVDRKESDERRIRESHRFPVDSRVIGMFGFVTWPKRPEVVFEAFGNALREDEKLRLLIVGEAAPNVDLEELARRFGISEELWSSTGWTSDLEFDAALVGVDRVVSLRYPSAGESSGALARIFAAGKPVAVSDYAQFAELPGDVVVKIPLGETEVEKLAGFMTSSFDEVAVGEKQRTWIDAHGRPETIAREYLDVLESAKGARRRAMGRPAHYSSMGVMPRLTIESFRASGKDGLVLVEARVRNEGDASIRSYTWGQPAYRLIVKLMAGGTELISRWWPLPRDLAPGESADIAGSIRGRDADEIRLVHGWFDLPIADETPFFIGEVVR